ncbi:Putative multidrug resistance protein MdtD [Raoultella planticola]|nr:Putative multidrug resistance protein MdtD [Raoultella planticola]
MREIAELRACRFFLRSEPHQPMADTMSTDISSREGRAFSAPALLVAGAFFMEFLDGTVIATALPDMAKDFGIAAVDLNIGISAYLITLAVLIPASGWIADRFGARQIFTLALAIFTLASVFAALPATWTPLSLCVSFRGWVAR